MGCGAGTEAWTAAFTTENVEREMEPVMLHQELVVRIGDMSSLREKLLNVGDQLRRQKNRTASRTTEITYLHREDRSYIQLHLEDHQTVFTA